jgi:hydrogenase maturation protein HypF
MDDTIKNKTVRFHAAGAVQGVGFRPFIYRLARELQLTGWVRNDAGGAAIEVCGTEANVARFEQVLRKELPAPLHIRGLERAEVAAATGTEAREFTILKSDAAGVKTADVMPDLATCPDCRREIFDPHNRRYRYPFSIVEKIPYDRPHTTMRHFAMCPACQAEYDDPADRRFHAQPNACPVCGPRLEWWDRKGRVGAREEAALAAAVRALRAGEVVAVKGLGGFHLMVDARNAEAVARLRARKHREEKPFAVMFPAPEAVRSACDVAAQEEELLLSPAAPIVLLRRAATAASGAVVSANVAPGNPYLGALLPYTPLHHLLLADLAFPVVATSGNLAEEPICTDEREALERLGGLADAFLVHNRPIARHVDDSIVRVVMDRELILRRARGFVPEPLLLEREVAAPVLAVGAHLKNTVALATGRAVAFSQHIGDLETPAAYDAFERSIRLLEQLYETEPAQIACDLHPGYLSTQYAQRQGRPLRPVQHHHAHIAACLAEHGLEEPVLGVAWDGTGYGLDGTIWGGEFLEATRGAFRRLACLRPFRLPGAERAVREPRRAALGLLHALYGDRCFEAAAETPLASAFTPAETDVLRAMLGKNLQAPATTSMGRLFDGVAALLGIRQMATFEGQAAMELEFAALRSAAAEGYEFSIGEPPAAGGALRVDWGPLVEGLLADLRRGQSSELISKKFHITLSAVIVAVARRSGLARVALSGGCFQNAVLLEVAVRALRAAGFEPCWHRQVPPNDGGLALGQIAAATAAAAL